jgi:hypothetical protein
MELVADSTVHPLNRLLQCYCRSNADYSALSCKSAAFAGSRSRGLSDPRRVVAAIQPATRASAASRPENKMPWSSPKAVVPLTRADYPSVLPHEQWRSDATAPCCTDCRRDFTVFHRRHHCRRCGFVFCDSCTSKNMVFNDGKEHRCCRLCRNLVQIGAETRQRQLQQERRALPAHATADADRAPSAASSGPPSRASSSLSASTAIDQPARSNTTRGRF